MAKRLLSEEIGNLGSLRKSQYDYNFKSWMSVKRSIFLIRTKKNFD